MTNKTTAAEGVLIIVAALLILSGGRASWGFSGAPTATSSLLRLVTLFRVAKTIMRYRPIAQILDTVFKSAADMLWFCCLSILFMLVLGLLGVQIFRGKMTFSDTGLARNNYEHLGWCVCIFIRLHLIREYLNILLLVRSIICDCTGP